MERILLSVEPVDGSWQISLRRLLLDEKTTKFAAIESANEHAWRRYTTTGRPTGVRVQMNCGESVLVSLHG